MLPKKTSLVIATFGALVLLLEATKLARPFPLAGALDFNPGQEANTEVPPPPRLARSAVDGAKPASAGPNLIDEHGSLKAFYQALWRTESKLPGAVTRVLHYGDSPVTADSITADARSLFQEHYGDAGHGFVLIAKPWAWSGQPVPPPLSPPTISAPRSSSWKKRPRVRKAATRGSRAKDI
jgi:hypothetical protein